MRLLNRFLNVSGLLDGISSGEALDARLRALTSAEAIQRCKTFLETQCTTKMYAQYANVLNHLFANVYGVVEKRLTMKASQGVTQFVGFHNIPRLPVR